MSSMQTQDSLDAAAKAWRTSQQAAEATRRPAADHLDPLAANRRRLDRLIDERSAAVAVLADHLGGSTALPASIKPDSYAGVLRARVDRIERTIRTEAYTTAGAGCLRPAISGAELGALANLAHAGPSIENFAAKIERWTAVRLDRGTNKCVADEDHPSSAAAWRAQLDRAIDARTAALAAIRADTRRLPVEVRRQQHQLANLLIGRPAARLASSVLDLPPDERLALTGLASLADHGGGDVRIDVDAQIARWRSARPDHPADEPTRSRWRRTIIREQDSWSRFAPERSASASGH